MEPYQAKINYSIPVNIKQYPLSKEKEEGIRPVIESLLKQGVIVNCQSPNNTPINPILNPGTNKNRFTQDLRKINEAMLPLAPLVPDVNYILVTIPATAKYFTVIELSSAFYSIPVHNTQDLFAFTYCNCQYKFTRLSMGYVDSPTVYAAAVQKHLSRLVLPRPSSL